MNAINVSVPRQRNRNYEDTHQLLIEKAGELILESGADGVSVSALARVTGINRSTIYYHFDTREALMDAAQKQSREQLAKGADGSVSRWVGIEHISDFFRNNPEVVASWVDNYIAVGDLRARYPQWDKLLAQLGDAFAELTADEPCDTEVYCALVLTSAFMVPRSFANSEHPFDSMERILERLHVRASEHFGTKASSVNWPTLLNE